jgi:hypothetical protein
MAINSKNMLFLVLAHDQFPNLQDEAAQRATWAHAARETNVIWLRGNADKPRYHEHSRELHVPVEDTQENILQKTIEGIRFISANMDFQILVRTNVSTYFAPDRISNIEKFSNVAPMAGGYVERTAFEYDQIRKRSNFISGTGIFLNYEAAKVLTELEYENYMSVPDDVAITDFLGKQKVKIINIPRNNLHITGIYRDIGYARLKSSVDSDRARLRMFKVDEIVNASKYSGLLAKNLTIKLFFSEFLFFLNNRAHRRSVLISLVPLILSVLMTKARTNSNWSS